MPYNVNTDKRIKKNYSNEDLKKFYDEKNNLMDSFYPHAQLSVSQFFETIFGEAINSNLLVSDNEYHSGKANGKMFIYSPSLSKGLFYKTKKFSQANKKLVLTNDNIYDLQIKGFNGVLASSNLHYGNKKGSLAYFCNFDIDFDDIYTQQDLAKLIHKFETNEIPTPTVLTSSGTGVHLIYRLNKPIKVYKNEFIQCALRALKSALCKKLEIAYGFQSVYKGKIKPLALDQMTRCPGSTTKLGEFATNKEEALKNICYSWEIGDSYSLEDIFNYAKEYFEQGAYKTKYNYPEFLIDELFNQHNNNLPISVKKVKGVEKDYFFVRNNLYLSWLKRCKKEIKEGCRYYAMLGLTAYALKCNVSKEILECDLIDLMVHYNKTAESPVTIKDVSAALSAYDDINNKYLKGETIARRCNLSVKHKKRNFNSQEKHLKEARKNAGRKSKEDKLNDFLFDLYSKGEDVKKMSLREIERRSGISKTTVGKYIKKIIAKIYNAVSCNTKKLNNKCGQKIAKIDRFSSCLKKEVSNLIKRYINYSKSVRFLFLLYRVSIDGSPIDS